MKIVYGYMKKYKQYNKDLYYTKSLNRLWALVENGYICKGEYKLWEEKFANSSNINLNDYRIIKIKRNFP